MAYMDAMKGGCPSVGPVCTGAKGPNSYSG